MYQRVPEVPELPCGEGAARAARVEGELSALFALLIGHEMSVKGRESGLAHASGMVRHATRATGLPVRKRHAEREMMAIGWHAGRGAREQGRGAGAKAVTRWAMGLPCTDRMRSGCAARRCVAFGNACAR